MSDQPSSSSSPITWEWDTGIGNSSVYNLAYLTSDALYTRLNLFLPGGKDKILKALASGATPEEAFRDGEIIPLSQIEEFRLCQKSALLEIHRTGKKPIAIQGKGVPVHTELYDLLHCTSHEESAQSQEP